jgi:hypothetical protein
MFISQQLHVNEYVERKLKKKEKGLDHSMKNVTLCLWNLWIPHDGTRPMIWEQRGNVHTSKRLYTKCAAYSRLSQKNAAARCYFSITRRDIFFLSFFLSFLN